MESQLNYQDEHSVGNNISASLLPDVVSNPHFTVQYQLRLNNRVLFLFIGILTMQLVPKTAWNQLPSYASVITSTTDNWQSMEALEEGNTLAAQGTRSAFILYKQQLIARYLVLNHASSVENLPKNQRFALSHDLAESFMSFVMEQNKLHEQFFVNQQKIMIQLALMHQTSSGIPASVLLALAAFKTGNGQYTHANNFFELRKNGKLRAFSHPKDAFRAFALQLSANPDYTPLFTAGNNTNRWLQNLAKIECDYQSNWSVESECVAYMNETIQTFELELLDF